MSGRRGPEGRTGGIDLVAWVGEARKARPWRRLGAVRGLQAEVSGETLAMRNRPQTSIHQLLVLLDHLYL